MLFNSFNFLFFTAAVIPVFYLLRHRYRPLFLLLASYFFYMSWKPQYIILVIFSTCIDYTAALMIDRYRENQARKKLWLLLSLFSNFGLLFTFKYSGFFCSTLNHLFNLSGLNIKAPVSDLILPVGISFYTFQTLSYTIDVYLGKAQPEKSFIRFSLFVTYFPQLVAGPIERFTTLMPQLASETVFCFRNFYSGLHLALYGLFKKVVVADTLALYVNAVFNSHSHHTGLSLLLATYFFAFQIYCDFSGYSDIARGIARIIGVDLMINFKTPYFSASIGEFWHRWHISLSTWFRDYLYIPLGGNRCSSKKQIFNTMAVFILSGLWHGANWTFIIWGALHGFYLTLGKQLQFFLPSFQSKCPIFIRQFLTFHLVLLSWVFFRAESLSSAVEILYKILNISSMNFFFTIKLYYCALSLFLLLFFDILHEKTAVLDYDRNFSVLLRWLHSMTIIFLIVLLGVDEGSQFIYFQF